MENSNVTPLVPKDKNNKENENTNNDIDFKRDYLLIESTNIINDYLNLDNKLLASKVG